MNGTSQILNPGNLTQILRALKLWSWIRNITLNNLITALCPLLGATDCLGMQPN